MKPPSALNFNLSVCAETVAINLADALTLQREGVAHWKEGRTGQARYKAKVVADILIGIAGGLCEDAGYDMTVSKREGGE